MKYVSISRHYRPPLSLVRRMSGFLLLIMAMIVFTPTVYSDLEATPHNSPAQMLKANWPNIEPAPEPQLPDDGGNDDWEPIISSLQDIPMVYVPEGCFMMGSTDEEIETAIDEGRAFYNNTPFPFDTSIYEAESPQHEVCLDAFWIAETEVTNSQYAACVDAGVCSPPMSRDFNNPNYAEHPVIQITWPEAVVYAEWVGGRLPTEAEWEYAARGPDAWTYPWGESFEQDSLNYCDVNCDVFFWADTTYDDGYALTAPIATYPEGMSWVGAMDMSGNVWEWVSSLLMDYPYDADDGREDPDAEGVHILRGGGFDLNYVDLRAAMRYGLLSDEQCRGYGLRIAADVDDVALPEEESDSD